MIPCCRTPVFPHIWRPIYKSEAKTSSLANSLLYFILTWLDLFTDFILLFTMTSLLGKISKEIKSVNPKGDQSWIFIRRTDAETEAPILWSHDAKNWLTGKDLDGGKDWRQEDKGMTEDETVGWHHRLDWHEFEQAPGVGDRQESLASCSPWGYKESDMIEQLNWMRWQYLQ